MAAAICEICHILGREGSARTHAGGRGRWARQGSNLRPTGYEPAALTAELRALMHRLIVFPLAPSAGAAQRSVLRAQCFPERATGFEPANVSLEG
jgi:hypothetical protein